MKTPLRFVLPALLLALPVAGFYFYNMPQPEGPVASATPRVPVESGDVSDAAA